VVETGTHLPLSALAVLRERTRELHTQLEVAIDVSAALVSVPSYIHLLLGYLNIYRPFEALLKKQDDTVLGLISETYQSRVELLERDLRALGVEPGELTEASIGASVSLAFPRLNDLDSVLGALYVVEGSALGGQFIYREIQQRLGIDAGSGAAFFFGSGEKTGAGWKRFITMLNQHVSEPERAAEAAVAMFGVFEEGLRSRPEVTKII
jgi:heme oxygenase